MGENRQALRVQPSQPSSQAQQIQQGQLSHEVNNSAAETVAGYYQEGVKLDWPITFPSVQLVYARIKVSEILIFLQKHFIINPHYKFIKK